MATMTLDKTVMMSAKNMQSVEEGMKTIAPASTIPQGPRTPPPERIHAVPTMMGISQELRREICEHVSILFTSRS
jgi:hypothetical protein